VDFLGLIQHNLEKLSADLAEPGEEKNEDIKLGPSDSGGSLGSTGWSRFCIDCLFCVGFKRSDHRVGHLGGYWGLR
jgi:hypothetical protein